MRLPFLILLLLAGRPAAGSDFAAPLLGFVHDPAAAAVHPLAGVPGAALLRAPLDIGFPVTRVAAAARYRALLVAGGDGAIHLARLSGEGEVRLTPVAEAGDSIAWSPSGESAAIYRRNPGQVRILPGLARSVVAPPGTDVAVESCDGASIAVSDDGQAWLFQCADGRARNATAGVSIPDPVSALAFLRASRDAIAVTRAGDLWRIPAAGTEAVLLRTAAIPMNDVIAIRATSGSQIVALSATGKAAVLDLESGEAAVYDCHCAATTLDPTDSETLFAVNRIPEDEPLQLFDAARRRFWFVPRLPAAEARP